MRTATIPISATTHGRWKDARAPDNGGMKPTLSHAGNPWRRVAWLGLVSLLIAIASESARAAGGPLLQSLGAGAAAVGFIAGAGELLGYTLRLAAGKLADRPGGPWRMLAAGTAIGLCAVAALSRSFSWPAVAVLLVVERIGRAVRSPARDVMVASLSQGVGHGRGFGFHRLFDQVGGIVGPLALAALLEAGFSYQRSFAILVVPAAGSLMLLAAIRTTPIEGSPMAGSEPASPAKLPPSFWLLCSIAALLAAGTADFALIAFHYARTGAVSAPALPALYAAAMTVEAGAALALGFVLHRVGAVSLFFTIAFSIAAAPLVFTNAVSPFVAISVWSAGMGGQYLLLRALVPQIVPRERWGSAFGWFNAVFGAAWFAGSSAMGVAYAHRPSWVAGMGAALQLSAVPAVVALSRKTAKKSITKR